MISQDVFRIDPGSLLTALQRLERGGWLDATSCVTQNSRRATAYRLTRAGIERLEKQTPARSRRVSATSRPLKAEA